MVYSAAVVWMFAWVNMSGWIWGTHYKVHRASTGLKSTPINAVHSHHPLSCTDRLLPLLTPSPPSLQVNGSHWRPCQASLKSCSTWTRRTSICWWSTSSWRSSLSWRAYVYVLSLFYVLDGWSQVIIVLGLYHHGHTHIHKGSLDRNATG